MNRSFSKIARRHSTSPISKSADVHLKISWKFLLFNVRQELWRISIKYITINNLLFAGKICPQCLVTLKTAYVFRQICQETSSYLKKQFSDVKESGKEANVVPMNVTDSIVAEIKAEPEMNILDEQEMNVDSLNSSDTNDAPESIPPNIVTVKLEGGFTEGPSFFTISGTESSLGTSSGGVDKRIRKKKLGILSELHCERIYALIFISFRHF
jgi:hypothetical protein